MTIQQVIAQHTYLFPHIGFKLCSLGQQQLKVFNRPPSCRTHIANLIGSLAFHLYNNFNKSAFARTCTCVMNDCRSKLKENKRKTLTLDPLRVLSQ
jgi:hypothetical protein